MLGFKTFWGRANCPDILPSAITVAQVDAHLHSERIRRGGAKVTHLANIGGLPTGAMFAVANKAYLSYKGRVLEWTPSGYKRTELSTDLEVEVLKPRSIVEAMKLGLKVDLHESANE